MTGDLSAQTRSRYLTVEEQGGVTQGNTTRMGRRNIRCDYFLPVSSVFADWGTALQGAASESCSQRGGALSGQAGSKRSL